MFSKITFIGVVLLAVISCNSTTKDSASNAILEVTVDSSISISVDVSSNSDEDVIFYNMLYPIDLGSVIEKSNSYFNSTLLNPLNNVSNYQESGGMALALGVYGADLSYLWVFNQSQQALSYFTAIKQLSFDIGIPNDYVKLSATKAELYTDNVDSLVSIARKAYYGCDEYLMNSGKEDLAVLILLGGWIETMHTAFSLYKNPNAHMSLKILSQKYSLASLYNLLNQYPNNDYIVRFGPKLVAMLIEFGNLQNKHLSNQLVLDTVNKTVSFSSNSDLSITDSDFVDLRAMVEELRNEIIE